MISSHDIIVLWELMMTKKEKLINKILENKPITITEAIKLLN